MKRLKASAALVCTLLMGWSQIIQPYSAYALSVQAAAASQSVSQTSNEYESQGASSQGAQDDASGSQGVTEWYGDDANAARPDGGVDSDSGEQPGIGIEESRVDESNGEAPTDDSTEMNSCEADSLEPNSWRFENGVLIDSDNGDIDAQSLTDDPLPNGVVARGIDVSNHQGTVDWNKVKAAGIDFAILKVGPVYGKPDDSFERNAAECERLGIPYGVYYYSYARSVEDANKEADRTLAWLGGHHPSLPVYYDLEDSYILQDPDFSKDKLTQIAQAFCNRMEAVGFKSGIYANLNWLNNYLNSPSLSGYDHWVAQYNWRCDYAGSYSFWQYSSSGNVPGVNGRCDMNYCFNGSLLNVDDSKMHIQYEAHVSNIGWMSSKRDGSTAGTTGQSKSVEDLKVSILNPVEDGSVQINANVSGVGWQGWDTPSASEGGTTGQGRAVEAVRLRLTGSLAKDYDVYYRVHASNIGWMAWAKDGEEAGTTGFGRSVEAVQIRLVKKGDAAPSSDGANVDYAFKKKPMSLTYRAHVSNVGWQGAVSDGATAGTTGRGLALEDLKLSLDSSDYSDGSCVQIDAHVSGVGWQGWDTPSASEGGTTGQGRAVEAVRLRLTGSLAKDYDVYYRVHASNIGWMAWAKDGEEAGTTGFGRSVEAVQIRLVKKGDAAPSSDGANVDYAFKKKPMSLTYRAHVSNVGWQGAVSDGATAGTTGRGLALEDLKLSLDSSDYSDGSCVQIDAHVSGVGWQGWDTPSASEGGTTGQGRAVEAVRLRLTGSLAKDYDVYYRVHASNIGWMAWAKDGEEAGTTGMSCSLEAVQIKLIKKGTSHPDTSGYPHLEIPTVTYSAQVKGAWQNYVPAGEVSGTTGQGIPITGFSAKTTSSVAGGIAYQLHLSNVGWTSGKTNGEQLSSTAESNSVEAIKISLSGDLATYFDVWYRVHVDNVGWLGWTKNGAVAGSTGYGTHVQAVQVRLTRKGANAPGSTVSPCLLGQPSAFANPMQKKIVDLARQVPSPGPGLCSEWIADIYERAGFRNVHTDACDYYWDYCKFTDYSQLKVGMVIAVPSHTHTRMGSIYGHVCLYIGNNQVMDNVGQIRTLDMAYWLDYYSTSYKPKWGWYDNVPLA